MNHDEWLALAAAYALDSIEPAERARFEEHLGECTECRRAVREFREVAGLLAHAAPQTSTPASLRARVLDQVRATEVARGGKGRRGLGLPWLAAAAGLILAIAGVMQAGRASSERARLAAELAQADSTLAAFLGPEVHSVSLTGQGSAVPAARVFWNHQSGQFVVTAFALPPAPEGRTYQLWAISEGKSPVSMGTFDTDADGRATVVLPVDPAVEALGFIDICGLTVEPDGGSEEPSEAPRLSGAWKHAD